MIGLLDDLRWALRYARRHPGFALAITSTLSISIAAATTAFGLASAVLWRPLPFREASTLVFVWEETEHDGRPYPTRVTGARHAAWRHPSNGLASISLFGAAGFTVESRDGALSVRGVRVSANYFETLGIRPIIGRTFAPADEETGNDRVVILSHPLWQERFGGRRDALGETLRLSGQPFTIVGVMPPETFPAWPVNPAIVTLDATPASVARHVVGESLGNAVAGIAIGCLIALAAGTLIQSLLVDVSAHDPATLGLVAAVLLVVAVVAALVPAIRAARIDPVAALRAE